MVQGVGMFANPVGRSARLFAQNILRWWLKIAVLGAMLAWLPALSSFAGEALVPTTPARFDWAPGPANSPVGIARGIHPGRVVWARDPAATKWAGNWQQNSDQWWTDANTDQARVDAMLSAVLRRLTGAETDEAAWTGIFRHYNERAKGLAERGYQPGETIAVKINLNNSDNAEKTDNKIDAAPQSVLAIVRQLVNRAHVMPADIVVYDARRIVPQTILTKVWAEFKNVRFVQNEAPKAGQPSNPAYGDHHGLEAADWVEGIAYSTGKYNDARMIPKQIQQATYLVNFALLKLHSYPYDNMEDGDAGQTAASMTGKNHFGSIKGTWELHPAIDTTQQATPHAYSPMVDLAASPNLGAKTILYLLDGLYSGRKWRSYPQHFPNPPFNNRVEPYENPDWPASLLASQDGVALDSVGLDILHSQTANNIDPATSQPRILIRENADDYLFEMADPEHAPSKTVYVQGGKPVTSLGVHEHWDSDATRRYSRNLDPVNGKGIELIYLPMEEGQNAAAAIAPQAIGSTLAAPTEALAKAGAGPAATPPAVGSALAAGPLPNEVPQPAPAVLPGKGLAQHDFFYAGEGKEERMFIVRDGKIAWSYTHAGKGEISDAVLLSNGNVLFAHQYGITEVNAGRQVVWNYDAPPNTEIHTAQPVGNDRVVFVQNGDPARVAVINKTTGNIEREFVVPVKNPKGTHGHFRHARLTDAGTLLVAHMDLGKVSEYDVTGRELWSMDVPGGIWSATPLKNGNFLLAGGAAVREVNRRKETVWKWTPADTPEYPMTNLQLATRLPNGNTIINNWFNQWSGTVDPANAPVQAIEVTPDKKVVWVLRSWTTPADLGPSTTIQILDEPSVPENVRFGDTTIPAVLPGKGVAQHPFLYTGEWDTRKPQEQSMFIVRDGKVVWQFTMPLRNAAGGIQEFDDATLLSNGNIIYSHMSGASEVTPDKKVIWNYQAPPGTEVHSVQSLGKNRVLIMRNGNPAQAMIIDTVTGATERTISIPTTVTGTHGQFRHIRMTAAGTILVPHMGEGKVVEYDLDGREVWSVKAANVWSAVRLKNGNTLLAGDWKAYAREVNPQGGTVWEFTQADSPDFKLFSIQTAQRLANGNTVLSNWCAGNNKTEQWAGTVQILEVTPDKRAVWVLSAWKDPRPGPRHLHPAPRRTGRS